MNSPSPLRAPLAKHKMFFSAGHTRSIESRRQQLEKLKIMVEKNSQKIIQAVYRDLRRAEFETYGAEVAPILEECRLALRHLKKWCRPQKGKMPLFLKPGRARIHPDPYGHVLIISPWNYPFSLSLIPLVGALAAGNVVSLKPSEFSPHSSRLLRELFQEYFDPDWVQVFEGDHKVSQDLLQEPFDYIFFTGSPRVGRLVMEAASRHLTPLTLELGGKSPCLVEKTAELVPTARRICWGKFLNAGQTCIAPDYLVVEKAVAPALIQEMSQCLDEFYGPQPQRSWDYGRIVNQHHHQRLKNYLTQGEILVGGDFNDEDFYLAPTLIRPHSLDTALMNEEIFGPILPIIEVKDISEARELIDRWPQPLALYLFTENKQVTRQFIEGVSFGGGVINDTIKQAGPATLPFGGVGNSGMGQYHGRYSFETFSRKKTVLHRPTWLDPTFIYPPYTNKLRWLKKLF